MERSSMTRVAVPEKMLLAPLAPPHPAGAGEGDALGAHREVRRPG
jgi:hypothetical protein